MKMIDELKSENDKLLEKFSIEKNREEIEKHTLIKKLLETKNFINIAKIETVYQILSDLGLDRNDFKEIYLRMLNNQ